MRIAQLQDVCEFVQGGRHKLSGKDFVIQGYPAIGAGGVNGCLPEAEFDRDAVVLSAIGARCGKCFLAEGRWSSLANTQVILPDPAKANVKFLWYQLNNEARWPRRGLAQPFIRPADVKTHEVYLPPLEEQRRIAMILDKADALHRKRKRALELLDTLTQSIFLDMFGDPVEAPRYTSRKLLDLVDSQRGISYGIVQRGEDQETGTSVLRISDIEDGQITGVGLKRTAPEIANKFRRTKLVGGEIVISIRGTVGRCAMVPSLLSGSNVSREIAVIPTTAARLNPFYLSLIRTHSVQRHLAREVKGVAQSGINLEDLRELPIIQPPQEELDRFLTIYAQFNVVEANSREQLTKAEMSFASLQHRAFSGQL